MNDWLNMSAANLGRGIGAGRIDPVELTESFLDAIAAHPDHARIYSRVTPERARAEARAAAMRARAGQRLSPLDGVPMSWKDLFDSSGIATEAGTKLLKGRVPQRDARVLRSATMMGTVCLGKTHMSELAFSGLGLNPMTATPPCVNDPQAVPGGSSSGAAASVAFGLAACGIGSDTGGSVRIPAAWNDLVGLKTTAGRLSLDGVVPLAARFDTVGPLTRNVEDAALVLSVLEGHSGGADLRGASLSGVRLAALRSVVLDDIREQPLKAALASPVLADEEAGWDPTPGLGAASDLYLHQLTGCIDDVLRGQDGGGFQLQGLGDARHVLLAQGLGGQAREALDNLALDAAHKARKGAVFGCDQQAAGLLDALGDQVQVGWNQGAQVNDLDTDV